VIFGARALSHFLAVILLATLALAAGEALADFGFPEIPAGLPENVNALSADSYIPANAYRYKHARVVWVNEAAWKERGVTVPPRGHPERAKFEGMLLDHFAYGVPTKGDDPERGFDLNRSREYFADRYGGAGMATNFGSARARSRGSFQTKGGGLTGLVGWTLGSHATGKYSADELFRDIVWGEVYTRHLPYGANRVLVGIDTGIPGQMLSVRSDPLRPGHYVPNRSRLGTLHFSDLKRVRRAISNIAHALPLPATIEKTRTLATREKIVIGMEEYVRRLALQYGTAVGRRMFHGATSHSNFELSGRFIDFATSTTLPGYAPAKVLSHIDPFGELRQIENYLVRDFADTIHRHSLERPELAVEKLVTQFRESFRATLQSEMLALLGLPRPIVEALLKSKFAQQTADLLWEVGSVPEEGTRKRTLDVNRKMPERTGRFELAKITETFWLPEGERTQALKVLVNDPVLVGKLDSAFDVLKREAIRQADATGVSPKALLTYGKNEAARRNADRVGLYRAELDAAYARFSASSTRMPHEFQTLVDERLSGIAGSEAEHGPFETVVREEVGDSPLSVKQTLFDAVTERERTQMIYGRPAEGNVTALRARETAWCRNLFQRWVDRVTSYLND
jgi:hypothetical protein